MPIEFANETIINVTSLPGLLPPGRNGKRINYATLWRWILHGVKTPSGIVRLDALKCGSRWITSMQALERFLAAQTPRFDQNDKPVIRTPGKRQRAAQAAAKQLEAIGI